MVVRLDSPSHASVTSSLASVSTCRGGAERGSQLRHFSRSVTDFISSLRPNRGCRNAELQHRGLLWHQPEFLGTADITRALLSTRPINAHTLPDMSLLAHVFIFFFRCVACCYLMQVYEKTLHRSFVWCLYKGDCLQLSLLIPHLSVCVCPRASGHRSFRPKTMSPHTCQVVPAMTISS